MKSWSEKEIFSKEELQLFNRATRLVNALEVEDLAEVRCHELARAVAHVLNDAAPGIDVHVQDGYYGFVDHSWIWTTRPDPSRIITPRLGLPNILDVYSVGRLPLVQLVDCQHPQLPHVGWAYRPGELRKDIQHGVLGTLIARLTALL